MKRPDPNTLASVNEKCHTSNQPGLGNLTVGKVYAHVKKHYQDRRVREVEIRPIIGLTKLNATLEHLVFNLQL